MTSTLSGERVRAFVPSPLPPSPQALDIASLQAILAEANQAIGRLDGMTSALPDLKLFLYSYVRKEAVLSSQIEGTQSSLSDLLLYENAETPGVPLDDVQEVSNYVAALNHGLKRMRDGFPLSLRLIREIHEVLLSKGRGSHAQPGQFRKSQELDQWGQLGPVMQRMYLPPHRHVLDCMGQLETFIHQREVHPFPAYTRPALCMHSLNQSIRFLTATAGSEDCSSPLCFVPKRCCESLSFTSAMFFRKHRRLVLRPSQWNARK